MTRVNTLNEIADIYLNKDIINEKAHTDKVGKSKPGDELEDEKKASKSPAKNTGPEAAENYESKVNEAGTSGKRDEKNHFSTGKSANESINNRDMSKKKSIFDKLYEDVLGGDDDMDMDAGFDSFGDDEGFGDDEDSGDDEVTLTLPRDLAEKLYDALSSQMEDDDVEDIEDTEDMDELDEYSSDDEDDEMMHEAPEAQDLGHAVVSDLDRGNLKGKNNKVSGSGSAHRSGKGSGGDGKVKQGDGKPSELGDHSGQLTGKNNKVAGRVKGRDQELFD